MAKGLISASLFVFISLLLSSFFLQYVQTFFLQGIKQNNSMTDAEMIDAGGLNGTSIQVQIISDMHIEFPRVLETLPAEALATNAPYLALLGDIGYCT